MKTWKKTDERPDYIFKCFKKKPEFVWKMDLVSKIVAYAWWEGSPWWGYVMVTNKVRPLEDNWSKFDDDWCTSFRLKSSELTEVAFLNKATSALQKIANNNRQIAHSMIENAKDILRWVEIIEKRDANVT